MEMKSFVSAFTTPQGESTWLTREATRVPRGSSSGTVSTSDTFSSSIYSKTSGQKRDVFALTLLVVETDRAGCLPLVGVDGLVNWNTSKRGD